MSSTFKLEHKFLFMAHLGVSPSVTNGKAHDFVSPFTGKILSKDVQFNLQSKENHDS